MILASAVQPFVTVTPDLGPGYYAHALGVGLAVGLGIYAWTASQSAAIRYLDRKITHRKDPHK